MYTYMREGQAYFCTRYNFQFISGFETNSQCFHIFWFIFRGYMNQTTTHVNRRNDRVWYPQDEHARTCIHS